MNDSLFVRLGDVASAALVFIGTTFAAASPRRFARVNILLAVTGLTVASWWPGYRRSATSETNAGAWKRRPELGLEPNRVEWPGAQSDRWRERDGGNILKDIWGHLR